MPKMKTHSGAKKRFKRKRSLGAPAEIASHDVPRVKKMLGVGK